MAAVDDHDVFRILILGDGNFSFALALARLLWHPQHPAVSTATTSAAAALSYLGFDESMCTDAHPWPLVERIRVLATSFDSREQLLSKYGDSKDILAALDDVRFRGFVDVEHGVNAWELPKQLGGRFPTGFNLIIWNHPHLGTEDFRLHRFLMAHFFDSVAKVLRKPADASATTSIWHRGGRVRVSLVEGQETRWDVARQAQRAGLGLVQVAWFNESLWPGYVVKRNKHGGSFKNEHTRRHVGTAMRSCYFTFAAGSGFDLEILPEIHRRVIETHEAATYSESDRSHDKHDSVTMTIPTKDGASDALIQSNVSDANRVDTLSEALMNLGMDLHPSQSVTLSDTGDCNDSHDHRSCSGSDTNKPKKEQKPSRKALRKAMVPADMICPHCHKQLTSARAYTQHVHMVHELSLFGQDWAPSRPRQLQCDQCSKTFATDSDLWQHQISKHTSVDLSDLPSAPDNAYQQSSLESDPNRDEKINGFSGAADQDYNYVPCLVCGQAVVRREWGMLLHLESLKPALGLDMQCPLCNKTFIEQRALYQHYKFCRLSKQFLHEKTDK